MRYALVSLADKSMHSHGCRVAGMDWRLEGAYFLTLLKSS